MATPLTKRVSRAVTTRYHDLVVTLTPDGVEYREKRRRKAFLIPHGVAFQRAIDLAINAERAAKRAAKKKPK